jgi:5-methylcytosine-specific restriction endonuclease McrA
MRHLDKRRAQDREAKRREFLENPEKVRARANAYRQRTKDKRNAHRRATRDERVREYERLYTAANADKIKARRKARYQREREQSIQAALRWNREHKDRVKKWRSENKDIVRRIERAWREKNPAASKAIAHARRARKKNANGRHTAADILSLKKRQRGKCYWCKLSYGKTPHVDHVWPLALGGSNGPENLVLSCQKCNCKKWAKTPMEWAGRLL